MEAIDNDWDVFGCYNLQCAGVHGAMWNLSVVHDPIAETLSPREQGWQRGSEFTEYQ